VRRLLLLLAAAAALLLGAGTPGARASNWCVGDVTSADRPDAVTGPQLHVVYAFPSDVGGGAATWASQIVTDLEAVDAWWRGQDPARTLRFDLASVAGCSGLPALDLSVLQLQATAAQLAPSDGRFEAVAREVLGGLPALSPWKKVVVYYDGPVDDPNVCGTGGGSPDTGSGSFAIVWASADCETRPERRAWVVAHEIVHALGAPSGDEPHPYGDDTGHVGDSDTDLMFPYAGDAIGNAVLDVGRDDYYRHGGSWFDLATSAWLRHLDAPQQPLAVTVAGTGAVSSDLPGVDCAVSCTTQWDSGTAVTLTATPGDGSRFLGWRGGCSADPCSLTLDRPESVEAVFGPDEFRLSARVSGKGSVIGGGVSCPKRCSVRVSAGGRYVLRARAARGWRLGGWSGACHGRKATCTIAAEADRAVGVRFVRVKTKKKR
jgi:hypothetical protein